MRIGRRSFIQGTACVATAPAFAGLVAFSSAMPSPASTLPKATTPGAVTGGQDKNCVTFKIAGWDCSSGDDVLISINQSWRTAWR